MEGEQQKNQTTPIPPQHVGSSCVPDWLTPEQVYPRAVIGQPAPYFEATAYHNIDFTNIKITDYLGKYVVLFFWPLDFTFVCPTEILSFADSYTEFEQNDCVLIGASTDSQFSHFQYCQTPRKKGGLGDVKIPLIADFTKCIARIYGALLTSGPDAGAALR